MGKLLATPDGAGDEAWSAGDPVQVTSEFVQRNSMIAPVAPATASTAIRRDMGLAVMSGPLAA
jgi:hypothetical protein